MTFQREVAGLHSEIAFMAGRLSREGHLRMLVTESLRRQKAPPTGWDVWTHEYSLP